MPNIGTVLKDEISRLAKKEAKSLCGPLAGAVIALKKTVAKQKKEIAALQTALAKQEKHQGKGAVTLKPEELEKARLGAKSILRLRTKLHLSRAEMAKLIGVNPNSIFLWETGKVAPRATAKAKILALRKLGKRELKKRLTAAEGSAK